MEHLAGAPGDRPRAERRRGAGFGGDEERGERGEGDQGATSSGEDIRDGAPLRAIRPPGW